MLDRAATCAVLRLGLVVGPGDVTDRFTYCHRPYESDELYDRETDPGECVNLATNPKHAATVADHRTRLLDWLCTTADVIPCEQDARFDSVGAVKASC